MLNTPTQNYQRTKVESLNVRSSCSNSWIKRPKVMFSPCSSFCWVNDLLFVHCNFVLKVKNWQLLWKNKANFPGCILLFSSLMNTLNGGVTWWPVRLTAGSNNFTVLLMEFSVYFMCAHSYYTLNHDRTMLLRIKSLQCVTESHLQLCVWRMGVNAFCFLSCCLGPYFPVFFHLNNDINNVCFQWKIFHL